MTIEQTMKNRLGELMFAITVLETELAETRKKLSEVEQKLESKDNAKQD